MHLSSDKLPLWLLVRIGKQALLDVSVGLAQAFVSGLLPVNDPEKLVK